MGNTNIKFSKCNFCNQSITDRNPYIYSIEGLGKYDGYKICNNCLIEKLVSRFKK